jgi:F-type H+-transporting ATPase subunit b
MSDLTTLLGAEGGGVLAIPTYELIIGLVAFFIVFGALAKFALPKVKVILDEREEAIAGGIRKAEQAQQESAQLKEELSAELAAARRPKFVPKPRRTGLPSSRRPGRKPSPRLAR